MALTGPDVSRHQGEVDWFAVKRAGHTFAFCKATDGIVYGYTAFFKRQFAGMVAAGLRPGAYHWLQDKGSPTTQARYFVEIVRQANNGSTRGVVMVVDVEKDPDGTYPTYGQLLEFAAEFGRLTSGQALLVYTGKWFWVDYLKNPNGAVIGQLWHSEYETTDLEIADGPELDNYGGWSHATFWQYTSSGSCPGVSGRCDLNIFYGSHDDLAALGGTSGRDWFDMATLAELDGLLAKHAMIIAGTVMTHINKVGQLVDFVRDPDNPAVVWLVFGSVTRWALDTSTPEGAASLGDFQNHWRARGCDVEVKDWAWYDIKGVPVANGAPPAVVSAEAVETVVREVFADAGQKGQE